MTITRIVHVLKESGLCFDRIRFLLFVLRHPKLKVFLFRYLRIRFSPQLIENARAACGESKNGNNHFSLACSYINVGRTYKTTGPARTALADGLVLEVAARFEAPHLLEVGVSDGSSSFNLLERGTNFASIDLTDRHYGFYEKRFFLGRLFFDGDRRFLGVKFLCFYINCPLEWYVADVGVNFLDTSNPRLQEFGLTVKKFDLFCDSRAGRYQIIKCSNVLTQTYFSDEDILRGVANLMKSLSDGGYLILSHNNDHYPMGEACTVLRREGEKVRLERVVNSHGLALLFS